MEQLEARELLAAVSHVNYIDSIPDGNGNVIPARAVIHFSSLDDNLYLREHPTTNDLQFADSQDVPDENSGVWKSVDDGVNSPINLRTNTRSLYFADVNGHNAGKIIFLDLNTYGQSLYVLQDDTHRSGSSDRVLDPPIVIESDNLYHEEPNIGAHELQVLGTINTYRDPDTPDQTTAGNIGLFSNHQVLIGDGSSSAGLVGKDITVATWHLGGGLDFSNPAVHVENATIDGADVSLTAAVIARDVKRQGIQIDNNEANVSVKKTTITASGDVQIKADVEDLIGITDGDYSYAAGMVPWGFLFAYLGLNDFFKNSLKPFANTINFAWRAAESHVTIDSSTIESTGGDIDINSVSKAASALAALQTKDDSSLLLIGKTGQGNFLAAVAAIAESKATVDITGTTDRKSSIQSKGGNVSIGSTGSTTANSTARTLAGYRNRTRNQACADADFARVHADNICARNGDNTFTIADNVLSDAQKSLIIGDQYQSNEATKTFAFAFSYTNLDATTTIDANSTIDGKGTVSITSDGSVSNNPTSTSRSFGDGTVGVSISVGVDSSNVKTTVEGTVQSGGAPPLLTQYKADTTPPGTGIDLSDLDYLPLFLDQNQTLEFSAGDWIQALVDEASTHPTIGSVDGHSSLTIGDSYYVVDVTDNQLQLAYGPSLDLNLPRDYSGGWPVDIPLSSEQTLSVQVTREVDGALDPMNPNRPGEGYFYLPDHYLKDGQRVRYLYQDAVPDYFTAESTPVSTPYANWATSPSQPDNLDGLQDNLVMTASGTWDDVSGSEQHGYVLYMVDGSYTYVPGPFTFADAVADATDRDGFVAFPTDTVSNEAIKTAADGNAVWLNASDGDLEGFWSYLDVHQFFTADSTTASTPYANWAENQPDNDGDQEHNLVMDGAGTWNDVPSTEKHGYVLYHLDNSTYRYIYTYVDGSFTFDEAVSDATSKDGFVAFPKNAAVNEAIRTAANGKLVWLNASDSDQEGIWTFWDVASLDRQITGLIPDTDYYVITHDDNYFGLAASPSDALAEIAIPVLLSTRLDGNYLQWTQDVAFDPSQLDETTDRLHIDLSQVPGIQTGDAVVYQVDPNVVRYAPLPVTVGMQPASDRSFVPTDTTTLDVTVFDPLNNLWVFPAHGLQTGDVLTYNTLNDSAPLNRVDYSSDPDGEGVVIEEGTELWVIVIDADRIRLALTAEDATAGNYVQYAAITESATYSLTPAFGDGFTFDPLGFVEIPNVDTVRDTIWLEDTTGLATGQRVTYSAGSGNTAIGGLVSGTDYYLILDGLSVVGFADSWDHAQQGVRLDLTSAGTTSGGAHTFTAWGIDAVHDWLVAPGHGLQTGQPVTFQPNGGSFAGLVDGQVYYVVRLNGDQYRLVNTLAESGVAGQQAPGSTAPTGSVDLLPFDLVAGEQVVGFESSTIVQPFNPTLAAPIVDLDADTLALGSGWTTGDRVFYGAGGGEPIGGLNDETTYVVIALTGDRIALAASDDDATNGIRIDLTSRGTLGLIGHFLRLVPEVELEGEEQPVVSFDPTLLPSVETAGDVLRISRHGYADGDQVTYLACDGAPIGGLEHGGVYFVKVVDADHFQLLASVGDPQVIDLSDGATGSQHGFEVNRVIALGDVGLVGLSRGQTYYAIVDRAGADGLLRLAPTWLEAQEASLVHFDLTTSATGYANVFQIIPQRLGSPPGQAPEPLADLTVQSKLTATNSATAYPNLGGDVAFWEVLSYPEYAWNANRITAPLPNGQHSAFGNAWRGAIGRDLTTQQPRAAGEAGRATGKSTTLAFAMAEVDHSVITTISPGATIQSAGSLTIDASIDQSGTVVCWGGVAANRNTQRAVSIGVAIVDHNNTAQTNIGVKDGQEVTLDATGEMSLTTDINYDRLFSFKSYREIVKSFTTLWKSDTDSDRSTNTLTSLEGLFSGTLPGFLGSLGLSSFLNVWVNTTNYSGVGERAEKAADASWAFALAETFYRNTSEVTVWNTDINQDASFGGDDSQSVTVDAATSMTLISLAGIISFDTNFLKIFRKDGNWWSRNNKDNWSPAAFLGNFDPVRGSGSKNGKGIGASQILVSTRNRTRARVLGTSRITTGPNGSLTVNAQEIGKRTVLAQSGARAGGNTGVAGSVAIVIGGDDKQGASLTVAQIDRGVSVANRSMNDSAGDLSVTAHNHSQTWVQTGAVASSQGGSSVGLSIGLIDTPRTTLAYLGTIPTADVDEQYRGPDSDPSALSPGVLNVNSVTVDAQNTGWSWNISVVGSVSMGVAPVAEPADRQNEGQLNQVVEGNVNGQQDQQAEPNPQGGNAGNHDFVVLEPRELEGVPNQNVQQVPWWRAPRFEALSGIRSFAIVDPQQNRDQGEHADTNQQWGFSGDTAWTVSTDQAYAVWNPADFHNVFVGGSNEAGQSVEITAINNTNVASLSGGLAITKTNQRNGNGQNQQTAVALAGSFAVNEITMDAVARLGNSPKDTSQLAKTSLAVRGDVTVDARTGSGGSFPAEDEEGNPFWQPFSEDNQALFLAGSASLGVAKSRSATSVAGGVSLSLNDVGLTTDARVHNVDLQGSDNAPTGDVKVTADDKSRLSAVGGVVEFSWTEGGGYGVGIGGMSALNYAESTVAAQITDSSVQATSVDVIATANPHLNAYAIAGAVVIGDPLFSISGAFALNQLRRDVTAQITGDAADIVSATTNNIDPDPEPSPSNDKAIAVRVSDQPHLHAVSAGAAIAFTTGRQQTFAATIGAAVSHNELDQRTAGNGAVARIEGVTIVAPDVDLLAEAVSEPTLIATSVPLGVLAERGKVGVNIAGALSFNRLRGEVTAQVNAASLDGGGLEILADYRPEVQATTFEVAFSWVFSTATTWSIVVGVTWTWNKDEVNTSATLGDATSSDTRTLSATGDVVVQAFRQPRDSSDSTAMYVSHSIGSTINVVAGNRGAVGIEVLGMFAYNSVEGDVTATLRAIEFTKDAASVTVEAVDLSTIHATAFGLSVGFSGSSESFALTLAPITQVAANFESSVVTARVQDSYLTVSGNTTVRATKTPYLHASSRGVQFALDVASTFSWAGGLIYTNIANNSDKDLNDKAQDSTDAGAHAQVINSTITSTLDDISVLANAAPHYETTIFQLAVDASLAGTAAFAASVGWVRSRNRLYDTVSAKVSNSTLKADMGSIQVHSTLAPPDLSTANIETTLQSYLVTLAVGGTAGLALELGGANSKTLSYATVEAVVENSNLSAATDVSVIALDQMSIDNSWNSFDVAGSFAAETIISFDIVVTLPTLQATIANTVNARIELSDSTASSISETGGVMSVAAADGTITVEAKSTAALDQEVKQVEFGFGFGVTVGSIVEKNYLEGEISAQVVGGAQKDSLQLTSSQGDIHIRAHYAGDESTGPQLISEARDWGFELVLAALEFGNIDWTVNPTVTAEVTRGARLEAGADASDPSGGDLEISAATRGRLLAEVSQTVSSLIGLANAHDKMTVTVNPNIAVNVGDSDDSLAPILQARTVTLTTESQLDATGQVEQWSYGAAAIAAVQSDTTVKVSPILKLTISDQAAISATSGIVLQGIAGTNRNPHPTDVKSVAGNLDLLSFGTVHYLNDGDRLKYVPGTDSDGNLVSIEGLTAGMVYQVFPANETTIQLGEEFHAPLVLVNQDRLIFTESTAFQTSLKNPDGTDNYSLEAWDPDKWDTVIYDVPAGTEVGGLTPGRKYLVNKMSDSVVMLFEYEGADHSIRPKPVAPKAIDNTSILYADGATPTIFNVPNHGFTDGQVVSYVAPISINLGAGSVNTTATLDNQGTDEEAVILKQGGQGENENAIFIGPQFDELNEGELVTYYAGDAQGNWYWNDAPEGNVVGARGEFWDSEENKAADAVYTNWATNEPAAAGNGVLVMNQDGTWSHPTSGDLQWYVVERPVFVALQYAAWENSSFSHNHVADWVQDQADEDGETYWLPSISSAQELAALEQVMGDQNIEYAWLGGTDQGLPDTWVWDTVEEDPDNKSTFWRGRQDGEETTDFLTPWASSEPNDLNSKTGKNKESFLLAKWDGTKVTWNDVKNHFKDAAPDAVNPSYVIVERTRYKLVQATSREEALQEGEWLATIGSASDNQAIQKLLQDKGVPQARLGGAIVNGIDGLTDGSRYKVSKVFASPDDHYQSIRLTDLSGNEIQTAPPVSSFTFRLVPEFANPITGLADGKTYTVETIDEDQFRLQELAADGTLQPVVLDAPQNTQDGKGSFLGTLGVDLTSAGTGTHRLIFDLTNDATFTDDYPQLQFQTQGSTNRESGTGTATAIGTAHTGALLALAKVTTTADSSPEVYISLAAGSDLQATDGTIRIHGTAYGNAVSSAFGKSGGVTAQARVDAEITAKQKVLIDLQGFVEASEIDIQSSVDGRANVLSQSVAKGLIGFSGADARVHVEPVSWVQIGMQNTSDIATLKGFDDISSTEQANTPAELLAGTELNVHATMGMAATVRTGAVTGAAFGSCLSNWNRGDQDDSKNDIWAIWMQGQDDDPLQGKPDDPLNLAARVTVGNARLEVTDPGGLLNLDASVVGVTADAQVKAEATGLLANEAAAQVHGDLDASVQFLEKAWLSAPHLAVVAREEELNWKTDAQIRRNWGKVHSTLSNYGDAQVYAAPGAQFLTGDLQVDARQLQTKPYGKTSWESDFSSFDANAAVNKKPDSDKVSPELDVAPNDDVKFIDWQAKSIGWAGAVLDIPESGIIPSGSQVAAAQTSLGIITITGVNQFQSQAGLSFGYTTADDITLSDVSLDPRDNHLPDQFELASQVSVTNLSPNDLELSDLDLSSFSLNTFPVTVNINGAPTNMSGQFTDSTVSRLTVMNLADNHGIRLVESLTAGELELQARGNVNAVSPVTLTGRRFDFDAGGNLGQAISTSPTDPKITLQSASEFSSVKASAGQDLALQVRFQPDSNGNVPPQSLFAAQQLDVRLLPWNDSISGELETNYSVQIEAISSAIQDRIVQLSGHMQPNSDWTDANELSLTLVGLDVVALISNQPNPPRLLVNSTGELSLSVASAGGGTSQVYGVSSVSGDVYLHATGDLVIDSLVSTDGVVTWSGTGSLLGATSSTPVVQAQKLILAGPGGLGDSATPLTTQVTWLEGIVDQSTGAIHVANTDAGSVHGLQLQNLTVESGSLLIVTSGFMTISGPVANTGGGNLSLVANGVGSSYQYVSGVMTYEQAQADAAERGGTLAAALSPALTQWFMELVGPQPQPAWLGGANLIDSESFAWTLPDGTQSDFYRIPSATPFFDAPVQVTVAPISFWRDGQVVTGHYANWADNEPGNSVAAGSGTENHGEMQPNGQWNDLNADHLRFYVLYIPEQHSYTLIDDMPRTFADAVLDARNRGGYVARVTSEAEQIAVHTAANGNGVWLNMSDEGHEGDWEYGGIPTRFVYTNWQNHQPGYQSIGYSNWALNEPNNFNGMEDNAVMNADGTWNDINESQLFGYVLWKQDGSYTLVDGPFTFSQAKADAVTKSGIVARVSTAAEQMKVKTAANGKTVWINNTDSQTEGVWLAADYDHGGYAFYSNWNSAEPNNYAGKENYAVMLPDGKWNDVQGVETHGYVLYVPTTGVYSYQSGAFTFAQALRDAANRGGYVAHVTRDSEQNAVKEAANGNIVWLNATDDGSEGAWRAGTYGSQLNAAVMQVDGTWQEASTDSEHAYVLHTPQNNQYKYINGRFTFVEAQADAASRGGEIARITTEAQQELVSLIAYDTVWINLTDRDHDGTWQVDYSSTSSIPANAFENWASQEPANLPLHDNLVMQADGTWRTESKSTSHAYVLYNPVEDNYSLINGAFTFAEAQIDAFERGGFVAKVSSLAEQSAVNTEAAGNTIWLNGWNDGVGAWRMLSDYPQATLAESFVNWAESFGLSLPEEWSSGISRGLMQQADGTWVLRDLGTLAGYLWQSTPTSIFVNSTIEAAGGNGNINLVGRGDIWLGDADSTASISSQGTGQIAVGPGIRYVPSTDYEEAQLLNGDGDAELIMQPGSQITSENGTIALLATGAIKLSEIVTGGGALVVADYNGVEGGLPDGAGTITSTASGGLINVTANKAIFAAEGVANGIGVGHEDAPLQTQVNVVAATTDKGDIAIENHGALTLGRVDLQLTGLLADVLKWKDVSPVTKLPEWMSQWFQQRQDNDPLIDTPDGHFVMGGAAILDMESGGIGTANLSIQSRDGNLRVEEDVPVINLDAGKLKLAALSYSQPAELEISETLQIHSEGGNNMIVLLQGDWQNPEPVDLPQATCDLYHSLELQGVLTQGQEAWMRVTLGCGPSPLQTARPASLLTSEASPSSAEGENAHVRYFFSTDRTIRDAATYDQAGDNHVAPLDLNSPGTRILFVRVFSPKGEHFTDYQQTITIADQLPSDLISMPTIARAGKVETFTWHFLDPGANDVHRATIAWGDGSPDTIIDIPVGDRTFQATHQFNSPGWNSIEVTLIDIASGETLDVITTQVISGIMLQDSKLQIIGSESDDYVNVHQLNDILVATAYLDLSNELNSSSNAIEVLRKTYAASDVHSVLVYLFDGNDVLLAAANVIQAIEAHAGGGDDSMIAGLGPASFYGDSGVDHLRGGPSADILDGGADSDVMEGYDGPDTFYLDSESDVARGGNDGTVDQAMWVGSQSTTSMESMAIDGIESLDMTDSSTILTGTTPPSVARVNSSPNPLIIWTSDYLNVNLGHGWESVRGTIHDDTYFRIYTGQGASLQIGGPIDSTNPANPADVNNDILVTPLDALIIINALSRASQSDLNSDDYETYIMDQGNIYFLDSSADGRLTESDVLHVIDVINRPAGPPEVQAESEAIVVDPTRITTIGIDPKSVLVGPPQSPTSSRCDPDDDLDPVDQTVIESSEKQTCGFDAVSYAPRAAAAARLQSVLTVDEQAEEESLEPTSVDLYFSDYDGL